MTSIRLFNDDSRFYIVIENPSEEDKKAAMKFVSEQIGIQEIKEETPEGVLPTKVEPYKVPENLSEVKQEKPKIRTIKTPQEFIDWFKRYPELDESDRRKVKNQLRFYYKNKIETSLKENGIEPAKTFLSTYKEVLISILTNILKKNGYNDLEAFINTEGESNIIAAYNSCKEYMENFIK